MYLLKRRLHRKATDDGLILGAYTRTHSPRVKGALLAAT